MLRGIWVGLCHSSASSPSLKTRYTLVTVHRAGLAAPWVIWPLGLVSTSQNSSLGDSMVPGECCWRRGLSGVCLSVPLCDLLPSPRSSSSVFLARSPSVSWHLLSLQMCVLVFQHFGGFLEGSVLGRSSLKMLRNGVKNKHGPVVGGFQPRAVFREMGRVSVGNEWNFRAGRLQSQWSLGHPARRTRGHSWCHITADTELCPSGELCGHCPLHLLMPRLLELPPQFLSLPFLTRGSCHVHPLTWCLLCLVWGFFCCFFSAPPHCPGGSSTQSAFKHLVFDLQNSPQKL